ncbi:hypothetical protein Gain_0027_058 [Komagataeibacter intermedius TF2]|uniref:Uncharacterized protein n=1 Tax=Komagataeibacter intermedius NRIC 0521 TaxID=1307934 RepID=A0ABQ0PGW7_9PROT|nr:hypothetical protein Gain_0027_058 [Komagataeibacter intermedius TF2]GBQ68054.1 hypothetical protein AA0521_1141 [Komagataeibacter intermedius NRIC 0521]
MAAETILIQTYSRQQMPWGECVWPDQLRVCRSRQEAMMRFYQVKAGLSDAVGAHVFCAWVGDDGQNYAQTLGEVGERTMVNAG